MSAKNARRRTQSQHHVVTQCGQQEAAAGSGGGQRQRHLHMAAVLIHALLVPILAHPAATLLVPLDCGPGERHFRGFAIWCATPSAAHLQLAVYITDRSFGQVQSSLNQSGLTKFRELSAGLTFHPAHQRRGLSTVRFLQSEAVPFVRGSPQRGANLWRSLPRSLQRCQPRDAARDASDRGTVAHHSQIGRHRHQRGTMLKRDFGVLLLSVCALFLSLQHEGAYQFRKAWWVARGCCRVLPPPPAAACRHRHRHCSLRQP